MNSKMKKLFPLVLIGVFTTAGGDDCGGCFDSSCPEEFAGNWEYQRLANGGALAGGETVVWQLTFRGPSQVTFAGGRILKSDDIGSKVVWRYSGNSIQAQYLRSDNSVTFQFDDMMPPRRTSFSGELVSGGRMEGDGWVANLR